MITTTADLGWRSMMNNTDWRPELAPVQRHHGLLPQSIQFDSLLHRTPYRAIPGGQETPANAFYTLWRNGMPIGRA
jgi:hypothetical protein